MTFRQRFILGACVTIVWLQLIMYLQDPALGCDFNVYYRAGIDLNDSGWLYIPWLRYIFTTFTVFPPWQAYLFWFFINFSLWSALPLKLSEYKYGWIFAIWFTKISAWTLVSGNISPALAALCITPAGTLIAGLWKPQLFGYLIVHALVARFASVGQSTVVHDKAT